MSACRMLARVGNRPPRQPYSASTLTVSRCYERRGEERRVEQLYLSLSISLLSYSLPGCARVIVSTASSGSSPPSPEPLVLTPTPLVQLVLHPLSLSLSFSFSVCATSATLDRHLTFSTSPSNPRNLTSVNTDSQPTSKPTTSRDDY